MNENIVAGLLSEARRSLRLAVKCRIAGRNEIGRILEDSTVKIYTVIEEIERDYPEITQMTQESATLH